MAMVATVESSFPSLALKVMESVPLKSAFGVYVRFAPVPVSAPFFGCATTVKVRASFSASVADRVIFSAVSSGVASVCAMASGASFTAVTVIPTVATAESSFPSLALKVKESVPLKSVFGV